MLARCIKKILVKSGLGAVYSDGFGINVFKDLGRLMPLSDFKVVLDVGANIGQSMKEFVKLFPNATIYCFEPCASAFEELSSCAVNHENVKLRQLALASETGKKNIHCFALSAANSLLESTDTADRYVSGDLMSGSGEETVKLERLDNFLNDERIDSVDFLKIDTQGYDLEVLNGAGDFLDPAKIKFIDTEVIFAPLYKNQCAFSDILRLLDSKGFHFMGLYKLIRDPRDGTIKWCDALFSGNV